MICHHQGFAEFLSAERTHSLIHGTPTLTAAGLTSRCLFLVNLGTSCCWSNWLALSFHFVLLCSATALKIHLAAFLQKSRGQNPPSSWQAVGHHSQQSGILHRFFCLVIFNLDHFSNLFYNLAAQREVPGQVWSRAGRAGCPPRSRGRAAGGLVPSDHRTWLELSWSTFTSPNQVLKMSDLQRYLFYSTGLVQ